MSQGDVYVVTAEVRRSADQTSVVAGDASASRDAVADSVSTLRAAADVYDQQDNEAGGAIDSTVRPW